MSGRKKPVFGTISLALMLGLIIAAVLVAAFEPPPEPVSSDETFPAAIEAIANIVATLIAVATVSTSSTILALVSFFRREPYGPAAIGICLSLSSLIVVIIAIARL